MAIKACWMQTRRLGQAGDPVPAPFSGGGEHTDTVDGGSPHVFVNRGERVQPRSGRVSRLVPFPARAVRTLVI